MIFGFLYLFLLDSCRQIKTVDSFEAMNTFMSLQIYGRKSEKVSRLCQERVVEIEKSISTTHKESYIYKINQNPSETLKVDSDTYFLLSYGKNFYHKTSGALNIALYPVISLWGFTTGEYKIPNEKEITQTLIFTDLEKLTLQSDSFVSAIPNMQFDLGSLGKGYAGDELIKILMENNIKSALLDLGGNVQCLGSKPDGKPWQIGIKNPFSDSVILGIKMKDMALVTSGGYERFFIGEDGKKYIHIFNPKTGYPLENELASISILCKSGLYADALSTSLFVMGKEEAVSFWKQNKDFEMILITNANELFYTKALEIFLIIKEDFENIYQID